MRPSRLTSRTPTITTIRGETHNAMMDYCPICAKARANSCTTGNSQKVVAE